MKAIKRKTEIIIKAFVFSILYVMIPELKKPITADEYDSNEIILLLVYIRFGNSWVDCNVPEVMAVLKA